jgi:hypothetical protein
MSGRDRKPVGPDEVRGLFREAARGTDDGTDRLLARVPAAIAEAGRRRLPPPTFADALMPLARRWLPALAAASVLLVAIAAVYGPVDTATGTVADDGVERLVLIGALGENGTEDVLLGAIVGTTEEPGVPDGKEDDR